MLAEAVNGARVVKRPLSERSDLVCPTNALNRALETLGRCAEMDAKCQIRGLDLEMFRGCAS